MANIEDAKAHIVAALAEPVAVPDHEMTKHIQAALEVLHSLEDPAVARKLADHHAARRHGARRRAKLEAANKIRARLDAVAEAPHENGNTWRDGHVLGLEHAQKIVEAMSNDDPDDGV